MEIASNSSIYMLIADAQIRSGRDMEDVARELACAMNEVIVEGLTDNREIILKEIQFLLGWSYNTDHRPDKEMIAKVSGQ